MLDKLRIFAGRGAAPLAREICDHLSVDLGQSSTLNFKNRNTFVKIDENVRDMDCFTIHTVGDNPNDDLMETLITIDALKRASARRVTVIMPYYFYARSDKKDQPRISITSRLVADLLTVAGVDRVLTMDLHSEQIMGFFSKPMDQLLALPVLCNYILGKKYQDIVVVAPDAGGAKRARSFSWALNADLAIMDKKRDGNKDQTQVFGIIGDVRGKTAILVDDEIDTGGSIVNSVNALKEAGAERVLACCTHSIFSDNAVDRLSGSLLEEVIVTNTVPIRQDYDAKRIRVLSVADLFAKAILSIHLGTSVSALFRKFKTF